MAIARASAKSPCRASVEDKPTTQLEPASLLRPYQGVTLSPSAEKQNGVSVKHGALDGKAVRTASQSKAEGEVWVAAQGGFIVRYVLQLDGGEDEWGKGVKGIMRWDYSLTPQTNPGGLLPPVGCPLGMIDAPLPKDAADVNNTPGFLSLTIKMGVPEAANFFQKGISEKGWTKEDGGHISSRSAILYFSKPDRRLVVRILDASPTQVWIELERTAAST
jgi:hypothetical protein